MPRPTTHKYPVSMDQFNKLANGAVRHIIVECTQAPYPSKGDTVHIICLNSKKQVEEFSPKQAFMITHIISLSLTHDKLTGDSRLSDFQVIDLCKPQEYADGE